ncbi:acyl-CoA reductase [Niveibacterium sp.]|uniref:acyl-CoA reductase n=1 Tax=Niveibacterium sp. TaxID=2017444 RepID=UPI0035B4C6E1
MELILPHRADDNARAQLDGLSERTLQPFDARTLAFLSDFSARLLQDHALRTAPELVALGYWFRPAAVEVLRQRHATLAASGVLRPRGVVFHVAPANVDAVFVYSWFLSLLCGNRNIVRISRRDNAHRATLLQLLADTLAAHPHIAACNAVLAYERDDAISAELSALCGLRVVWGGNDTVAHFRRIALPPLATELVFSDRQSWALLNADSLLTASDDAISRLASAFHNDAFWFAQQACSSPRAVVWIGDTIQVAQAKARFWRAVSEELARRGETPDASELANRLVAAHRAAAVAHVSAHGNLSDWPLRLDADAFTPDLRGGHCGYGLFYEITRATLGDTLDLFSAADQTVAYFGFERAALTEWVQALADRAVDRVVPIGDALRFGDQWDGHDLLMAFSRHVVIA